MNSSYTLTLMRHAKSSWKVQGQADHDRALNARGHRDAPDMAQRMVNRGSVPDLILSSSATRALLTSEHLLDSFSDAVQLQVEPTLYLASPSTIVNLLQGMDPELSHVLVVAHNPGLEDLSAELSNAEPAHLPTAAIRQFSCPTWADLRINRSAPGQAATRLIHADYPKSKLA